MQGVLRAVTNMLEYAVELDNGRYTGSAAIILYVVRLVVRVESFMLFLVQHNDWRDLDSKLPQLNTTGLTFRF